MSAFQWSKISLGAIRRWPAQSVLFPQGQWESRWERCPFSTRCVSRWVKRRHGYAHALVRFWHRGQLRHWSVADLVEQGDHKCEYIRTPIHSFTCWCFRSPVLVTYARFLIRVLDQSIALNVFLDQSLTGLTNPRFSSCRLTHSCWHCNENVDKRKATVCSSTNNVTTPRSHQSRHPHCMFSTRHTFYRLYQPEEVLKELDKKAEPYRKLTATFSGWILRLDLIVWYSHCWARLRRCIAWTSWLWEFLCWEWKLNRLPPETWSVKMLHEEKNWEGNKNQDLISRWEQEVPLNQCLNP